MLRTRTMTAFASDIDLIRLRIVIDVCVTCGIIHGAYEILPRRGIQIALPAGQMATRAHGLNRIRIYGWRSQNIVGGSIAAIRSGRPPQIEFVVLPDTPLAVQAVITSRHVVAQQRIPGLPISK